MDEANESRSRFDGVLEKAGRELGRLDTFMELCFEGLAAGAHHTEFEESLDRLRKMFKLAREKDKESPPDLRRRSERAKALEEFAKREQPEGFPYLFGLVVVKLWSILENMTDDVALECLSTPEKCKNQEIIRGIEGPLIEFSHSSKDEQAEYLLGRLKSSVKASLKQGVGKFEALLEPLGMGGGVSAGVRRALFELSSIRNAFVHNLGIADKQLERSCPWLGLKSGDVITLNRAKFAPYMCAALWYIAEIHERCCLHEGAAAPDYPPDLKPGLERDLQEIFAKNLGPPIAGGGDGGAG